MNYTKGEWRAYRNALGTWSISTNLEPIAQVERHYNANLIAVAPKMYEALTAILGDRNSALAREKGRKALAEAEGGK